MKQNEIGLPTLIVTSVVRGSQQGESHGGIYLINFVEQSFDQVVDWNTSEIDFQGRGWDRGLRGIAFKQPRCRRGPAWWQLGCNRCSRFLIQVSEYLADHRRVFNTSNDSDLTTALIAGFNIDKVN